MSRKNRPGFPPLQHYDGRLIDRINVLYENIYGHVKYRDWSSFNENLPLSSSAYGIVSVNSALSESINVTPNDTAKLKQNEMLHYLTKRQGGLLPFLPIRSEKERKLVHIQLNLLVSKQQSLTSMNVFENLAIEWNTHHISISDQIYPKLPCHFSKYVKAWRKNRDRRDAEISSGARQVRDALEHVPMGPTTVPTFFPVNLNPASTQQISETDNTSLLFMATAASTQPQISTKPTRPPQRTRLCRMIVDGINCPDPFNCRGKNNRKNCMLIVKGNPSKIKCRSIVNRKKPHCFLCGKQGCIGTTLRSRCPYSPLLSPEEVRPK